MIPLTVDSTSYRAVCIIHCFFIPIYFKYTQYIKYTQRVKYDMMFLEERYMISYEPFFQTLLKKKITEYQLIYKEGISANTLHRMKKGLSITTKTIDTLCDILECRVDEIIRYEK